MLVDLPGISASFNWGKIIISGRNVMDQTINEMVYGGRINNTVRAWNEQANGKTATTGGTIIGSDGTSFKKVGNRLVQVLDPKMLKCVARLESKLASDGLLNGSKASACEERIVASSELVAEL